MACLLVYSMVVVVLAVVHVATMTGRRSCGNNYCNINNRTDC
jgi:hypothetical protein